MAAPDDRADRDELAGAVRELRRAVRDLKHDVRMLKVDLDRQQRLLEGLTGGAVRSSDQPSGTTGDDDVQQRRTG